ncbi:MAG: acyl-CoA/acyl-ACP dehydrogenase [Kaiparowitsia implicata GSE-PSE-MK54-09C]|jgi:alkylation response protein AidB-like acyl-CoA dehydrogenase|nr:acyl-CoA/acyl-ACP dehydrogenase [Kaiparowitsia implicata GSE-PSE-MK54-09C]
MLERQGEFAIVAQRLSTSAHTAPVAAELITLASAMADEFATQAAILDRPGAFPEAEFQRLAAEGFLVAPLRTALGGCGLGIDASLTHDLLVLLKHIGRGNLAVGRVYEGHVNALQLIQTFGTAEQVERYSAEVRDRHRLFGVWNAEDAEGLKILPLGEGRYRLDGAKTFCSGAGYVDRPFVSGTLPDGTWQMCIVPMDQVTTRIDPTWWHPAGMKATASYRIDFSGVELEGSDLMGQPGDYMRQPWLTAGVVRFAAVQLGGAEALFDLTRQFLQAENRTSNPFQQERLGQMAIALETGQLWLRGAADAIAAYAPQFGGEVGVVNSQANRLLAYTNMMRTTVEQVCMDMMQMCQRSVGTRGLLPPNPIERVVRDLTLYLRQPAYDAAISGVGAHVLTEAAAADRLWQ